MKRTLVLLALILSTGVVEAQYPPLIHVWNTSIGGDSIEVRDITGDLIPEIIVGLFNREASYVYTLNSRGELLWKNKISVIWPQNQPHCVAVGDLDLNGDMDIVVGSEVRSQPCMLRSSPYKTPLFMVERRRGFEYNTLKWQLDNTGYALSIYVADIAGDRKKEVIVGNREGEVYAVSSAGNIIWKYSTEGTVKSVYASDLNGDGSMEVVAGSFQRVHALKNTGSKEWHYTTDSSVESVYAVDIDSDNRREVLAVTENNYLHVLSHKGKLRWKYRLPEIRATVSAGDVDSDGGIEILIVSGKTIYALDSTGQFEWNHSLDDPVINVRVLQAKRGNESTTDVLALLQRKMYSLEINPYFVKDRTADRHYERALNYYSEGMFNESMNNSLTAAALYSELGDENSMRLANSIANKSWDQLHARELYLKAVDYFNKTEYDEAKKTAQEAYTIYERVGDKGMMNKTFTLIKDSMDYKDAEYFYKQSIELHRRGLYDDAKDKAKKALEIYLLLDDKYWMKKSSDLIIKGINYKNASIHFQEALEHYWNAGDLRDRGESAAAKDEYISSREKAIVAREYYESVEDERFVENVSKLIASMEDSIRVLETLGRADKNLEITFKYFNSSRYEECELQAKMALDLYYEAGEINKTTEAYDLMVKCGLGVNASRDYGRAVELRKEESYELSMDYARRARKLYDSIGDLNGVIKSGELILKNKSDLRRQLLEERIKNLMGVLAPIVIFSLTMLVVLSIPATLFVLRYRERIFGELRMRMPASLLKRIEESETLKHVEEKLKTPAKEAPVYAPEPGYTAAGPGKPAAGLEEKPEKTVLDYLEGRILGGEEEEEGMEKLLEKPAAVEEKVEEGEPVESLVKTLTKAGEEKPVEAVEPTPKPEKPETPVEKPSEAEEISERLKKGLERIDRTLGKKVGGESKPVELEKPVVVGEKAAEAEKPVEAVEKPAEAEGIEEKPTKAEGIEENAAEPVKPLEPHQELTERIKKDLEKIDRKLRETGRRR
jgi:tetratricopeptide (TPR) repeat protein